MKFSLNFLKKIEIRILAQICIKLAKDLIIILKSNFKSKN